MTISTLIRTHECPELVIGAVQGIFPEWFPNSVPDSATFPCVRDEIRITGRVVSIENMISVLRERKVLDTAMDAMAMGLEQDEAKFKLSRQSSSVGKVSFALDEMSFGGTIDVTLKGKDIGIWLEQQTWHIGREGIPRSAKDEYAMSLDGDPAEWFDSKGRRTIGSDDSA